MSHQAWENEKGVPRLASQDVVTFFCCFLINGMNHVRRVVLRGTSCCVVFFVTT